jgi:hypothetical protein
MADNHCTTMIVVIGSAPSQLYMYRYACMLMHSDGRRHARVAAIETRPHDVRRWLRPSNIQRRSESCTVGPRLQLDPRRKNGDRVVEASRASASTSMRPARARGALLPLLLRPAALLLRGGHHAAGVAHGRHVVHERGQRRRQPHVMARLPQPDGRGDQGPLAAVHDYGTGAQHQRRVRDHQRHRARLRV